MWAEAIDNSPSATSCLSTVQDFVEGFGFSDPLLEKKIINSKGESFFQFHQKVTKDWTRFKGVYVHVMYNTLGEITEIDVLPFQNCRLGKPDSNGYISKIHYNPFFGTSDYKGYDKKMTTVYDVYNPNAVRSQIANQKDKYRGQVLFVGLTSPLSPYYPINEAYSAVKWMKIESGVSDYHEDNLNNGFLQPFMLIMRGNPNEPSTNPDYANHNGDNKPATIAQEFDDVIASNFMGAKRVGNMLVQWVSQGEEKPEPIALPANNNGDLFMTLDQQAIKKITIGWKVPAILANINEGVSLGGDGNAVRVSVKLMQQRVKKDQRVLTDLYSKLLSKFETPYVQDITIVPYNPYPEMEVLDDKIWEALTSEEQRQWINDNTEIELIESTTEPAVVDPSQDPQPVARITNRIPVSFPEKVRNTAKKALEFQDKMSLKCSSKAGREMAQRIVDNQSMGVRELKRIYSYLKKNEKFSNSPFSEGCNAVLYQAWGGAEMFSFLESKLKEIDGWLN
jgi:hypothetical protein